MAALDITGIIRITLPNTADPTATEVSDTYIPTAEIVFEKITKENVTIASDTTGDLSWDFAIAYLAIALYYATKKEGHMVGSEEDRIPVYVWWEQTAYRYIVSIGYSEFFDFDNTRGMYNVKGKNAKAVDLMAVKKMTGDPDVI